MHLHPVSIICNTSVTKNFALKPGAANSSDTFYADVGVSSNPGHPSASLTVTIHPKSPCQWLELEYHFSFQHLDWAGWVPASGEMPHREWKEKEHLVFRKKNLYRVIRIVEAKWSANEIHWDANNHHCKVFQQFQGLVPQHSMPVLHFTVAEGTALALLKLWQELSEISKTPIAQHTAAWLIQDNHDLAKALEWINARPEESHLFVLDTRPGLTEAAQPHWKPLLRELQQKGHEGRLLWNPWTQGLRQNRATVNPWDPAVQTEVAHAFHALCSEQGFGGTMVHGFDAIQWQVGPGHTQLQARQAAVQWLAEQAVGKSLVFEGLPSNEAWPHRYDSLHSLSTAAFKKSMAPSLRNLAHCDERHWKETLHYYWLDQQWYHRRSEELLQSALTAIRMLGGIPLVAIPAEERTLDMLWNALAVQHTPGVHWKWHPQMLELQGKSEHCYINLGSRKQQLPGHAFTLAGFESLALHQA